MPWYTIVHQSRNPLDFYSPKMCHENKPTKIENSKITLLYVLFLQLDTQKIKASQTMFYAIASGVQNQGKTKSMSYKKTI